MQDQGSSSFRREGKRMQDLLPEQQVSQVNLSHSPWSKKKKSARRCCCGEEQVGQSFGQSTHYRLLIFCEWKGMNYIRTSTPDCNQNPNRFSSSRLLLSFSQSPHTSSSRLTLYQRLMSLPRLVMTLFHRENYSHSSG